MHASIKSQLKNNSIIKASGFIRVLPDAIEKLGGRNTARLSLIPVSKNTLIISICFFIFKLYKRLWWENNGFVSQRSANV